MTSSNTATDRNERPATSMPPATPPPASEMKCTICGLAACWLKEEDSREAG